LEVQYGQFQPWDCDKRRLSLVNSRKFVAATCEPQVVPSQQGRLTVQPECLLCAVIDPKFLLGKRVGYPPLRGLPDPLVRRRRTAPRPSDKLTCDAHALDQELTDALGQQGQRSLSCCTSKDFQHEVFVPTANTAFHGYTVAARMLLQQ